MRILVLGYMIRGPFGGMSWHHLHYLLGLNQMGHEVFYLEDSDNYASCYNPVTNEMSYDPSYGMNYVKQIFRNNNLNLSWGYYNESKNTWHNTVEERVLEFCSTADVALNLSAVNPLREWWCKIPLKVLVDTDPLFTQIKLTQDEYAASYANEHTHFFTFGENITKANCSIPTAGFPWVATRQPVYLDAWPVSEENRAGMWTTLMNWDSYREASYDGVRFGMKSLSFDPYYELPCRLPEEGFELAIGGPAPREKLSDYHWKISNPLEVIPDPEAFKHYVRKSKGEWTIAKHGYVKSNSGWFSERTLNYMASGKPVVVQDTGFTGFLPTGTGLLAFTSPEEAIESIKKVNADYHLHSKTARSIVEEFFNAERVLGSLLRHLV